MCGTQQGWRRWAGRGLLALGAGLTWVSILAAAPVKEWLDPKTAVIHLAIADSNNEQTDFLISNTGSQPAWLKGIEIVSHQGQASSYLTSGMDKKLIEPGKAYAVSASNGRPIPAAVDGMTQQLLAQQNIHLKANCQLRLTVVQMNGASELMNLPFACDDVLPGSGGFSPLQ